MNPPSQNFGAKPVHNGWAVPPESKPLRSDGPVERPQLRVWPPTWFDRNEGRLMAAYLLFMAGLMIYALVRGE
jgi:hypothetical protein